MTTIYVDVVLAENLWMNAIILFATNLCLKKKARKRRILGSALLGAIYVLISIGLPTSGWIPIVGKVIVSVCMVWIAFRPTKGKELLLELLLFYLVSILFGGCALLCSMFFFAESVQQKQGVWQWRATIPSVLGSALVGFILWKVGMKMLQKKEKQKQFEMELWFQNKCQKVIAFLDTGNGLKDPISKEPVIILEEECFFTLFGIKSRNLWEEVLKEDYSIRMIPFQVIGKKNGMLFTIAVDKVVLPELEICKEKILVGMQEGKLSKRGEYQALIGAELCERSRKNEFVTNIERTGKLPLYQIFR